MNREKTLKKKIKQKKIIKRMIKKTIRKNNLKKIKKRKRNPRYTCHALMLWHDLGLSYLNILSCILKHKPRSQREF